MERMVFIGVGQVAIVLVYRILDALQPQPVELGIFFIGNEPAICRKGVSIGGVYHLDHNKTLVLADGHLNEPALGVRDLLAGVQSVFHLVSQNCAQIYGGDLRKAGRKLYIVLEVNLGAGCLRRGAVDNRVNDVVSTAAHSDIPIGNIQKGVNVFLGFLIPGLFGKPQYRLEVVVKIVEALGVFLQILVERLIILLHKAVCLLQYQALRPLLIPGGDRQQQKGKHQEEQQQNQKRNNRRLTHGVDIVRQDGVHQILSNPVGKGTTNEKGNKPSVLQCRQSMKASSENEVDCNICGFVQNQIKAAQRSGCHKIQKRFFKSAAMENTDENHPDIAYR